MAPNVPKGQSALTCLCQNIQFLKVPSILTQGTYDIVVWIPKVFCLLFHHSRVIFTISNGFRRRLEFTFFYYVPSEFTLTQQHLYCILIVLQPTHRCILALIKKIIHIPLLEVKIQSFMGMSFSSLRPEKQAQDLTVMETHLMQTFK